MSLHVLYNHTVYISSKKYNISFKTNCNRKLRHMFFFAFQRLHLNVHDKNLVHDHKHHLISHLRRKYRKNKLLRELRSRSDELGSPKQPPRTLSYNLDGTRTFEERKTTQVYLH